MRWSFLCIVILLTACTKDFDFKLADTKPLYVIEGRISDLQGPYYIHITRSTSLFGYPSVYTHDADSFDAVQGAEVIIKDDMGTVDTLIPALERLPRMLYFYNEHKLDSDVRAYPSKLLPLNGGITKQQRSKVCPVIVTSWLFASAIRVFRRRPICRVLLILTPQR